MYQPNSTWKRINIALAVGLAWWLGCFLYAYILIKDKLSKKKINLNLKSQQWKENQKEKKKKKKKKYWRQIDRHKHE